MSPLPESSVLYRAPWVVPVVKPPIVDGAVLCAGGRIVAVGRASRLQQEFGDVDVQDCDGVLLPGLVNAHCHLELSHLDQVARPLATETMCDWIAALLAERARQHDFGAAPAAARQMLREQHAAGVALLLDIGNDESCLAGFSLPGLERVFLLECLAPTEKAQENVLARVARLPDDLLTTAHALYSTRPEVLQALKERADRLGHCFSLHLAESVDEIMFLGGEKSCFTDFMAERGAGDFPLPVATMRQAGVTAVLAEMGLLAENLLCVHGVHLSEPDLVRLAQVRASICLCPGSNRFLRVGRAPLAQMLGLGLLPALGTDSITSNESLDLWQEMRIVREDHPETDPATVLAMATMAGARAMGRADDYGSLAPGQRAQILQVMSPDLCRATRATELIDILTGTGRPETISWLSGNPQS